MEPNVIAGIISGVALLVSSGATYYGRQRALPDLKKRRICRSLHALLKAIKDIAHTGIAIGETLDRGEFGSPGDQRLETLIHLLEVQNNNLVKAQREFDFLSDVFDAKLPKLTPLLLHLRGKRDRIEILYAAAHEAQGRMRPRLQPWETSEFLPHPSLIRETVAEVHWGVKIQQQADPFLESDPDFERILETLPTLQQFIADNCEVEHLA